MALAASVPAFRGTVEAAISAKEAKFVPQARLKASTSGQCRFTTSIQTCLALCSGGFFHVSSQRPYSLRQSSRPPNHWSSLSRKYPINQGSSRFGAQTRRATRSQWRSQRGEKTLGKPVQVVTGTILSISAKLLPAPTHSVWAKWV